jgi:hypothetical protein
MSFVQEKELTVSTGEEMGWAQSPSLDGSEADTPRPSSYLYTN